MVGIILTYMLTMALDLQNGIAMPNNIFQASDLANQRVEVLDAARSGRARVRDKDGTGLVMLRESELEVLEGYAAWSQKLQRLTDLLASDGELNVRSLGDLAWLRAFDRDDIRAFADELLQSLIAGLADGDLEPVDETVRAWRVTARQLEDPLRREVLLSHRTDADFIDASAPSGGA